ncbi:MAG: hypothetical protein H6Q41_5657 [Deltaproteobacteria bacterium]|nr:hypothetical protein [Deltaproteobacteria bacterium]
MEPLEFRKKDRLEGRPLEAKRRRRKRILLSGFLLVGLLLLTYFLVLPATPPPSSNAPPADIPPTSQEPLHTVEGDVKERSTLFQSLSEKDIPLRWIDLIISKLKPYVNFRKIKGGTYRFIADGKGELVKFIYEASQLRKTPRNTWLKERKLPSTPTW